MKIGFKLELLPGEVHNEESDERCMGNHLIHSRSPNRENSDVRMPNLLGDPRSVMTSSFSPY